MVEILRRAWLDDHGQDIAEYAVMLAVILVIVVGSIRLIGSNANNVFSAVSSSLQAHKPHCLRMQVCPPRTRIRRDLVPDFSGGLGRGFRVGFEGNRRASRRALVVR
jgi:Flp pilus assembly pilin Flp